MSFVTAFNGARDLYEVPLALYGLGLLDRHVSDFYLPDWTGKLLSRSEFKIAGRYRRGLPSQKVCISLAAASLQVPLVGARGKAHDFEAISRALSLKAQRISDKSGSGLFLHSGCAHWAFAGRNDRPRWLYQYHPHSRSVRQLLADDLKKFPEVQHSFDNEADSQAEVESEKLSDEWTEADVIFCASEFTAKSLVAQGCDRDRIYVVPYGANITALGPPRSAKSAVCRYLFIGQGVQRKGLHHLLRVWHSLKLENATLTVVARRLDPGLSAYLRHSSIIYRPGVSASELVQLLAGSDVFTMPSLVEGFGLVFLEALAAGLFCIGTPNTGLPDLHLPSYAGAIADAGDLRSLSEVIVASYSLWRSEGICKEAIRAKALEWTWDRHADALRTIIMKLAG